jgi:hypothetical protein
LCKAGYHRLLDDEETRSNIPDILDQAIAQGIVCREVARIIAQDLRWRPKE